MKFNNSYAKLDPRLFHKQPPNPLNNPIAGHFNPIVAEQIGWNENQDLMDNWINIIAGSYVPDGFEPLAMAYAGHQFGQWAGQLGDGRGLLMAQVIDKHGKLTDLHLKGVGLTPYSRMGDGRAVLRSTIREYLCSHAMSCLGVKSSNALGFVTSQTPVRREKIEQGAALMRIADTHIRLGHVEWIASFAPDLLPNFTKYMIETYYPSILQSNTPVTDFLTSVIKNTAIMIADWQLFGFAHGVMNTDNLSITGSTIDYGPFGFLERFDPSWINNHSDYAGRYTYQNQPAIGRWNLQMWIMHFIQLSNKVIINDVTEQINRDNLSHCLDNYEIMFTNHYQQGICKKIGLQLFADEPLTEKSDAKYTENEGDKHSIKTNDATLKLAFELLEIIENNKLDYTNSFRSLIAVVDSTLCKQTHKQHFLHEYAQLQNINNELNTTQLQRWENWQKRYANHITQLIMNHENSLSIDMVLATLRQANPCYILRNAMAQKAIEQAEAGNFFEVERLFKLLSTPYEYNKIATLADVTPPSPTDRPLVISCSS